MFSWPEAKLRFFGPLSIFRDNLQNKSLCKDISTYLVQILKTEELQINSNDLLLSLSVFHEPVDLLTLNILSFSLST